MKRPNLLLITTDQQRFDTIAAAGNPHIRTPHLDWMLESGVHYSRAYSDSPVCVAARASLLTGRHYHNLYPDQGYWGQPTTKACELTLPSILGADGYQTKSIGKLHHNPHREGYGWADIEILEDYYRHMSEHPENGVPSDHGLGQNEMQPAISTVSESHSLTHWTVERGIDFLENRDTSRPFLLHLGFSKPHPPFDPCFPYWQLYQNAPVPDPVYGDWSSLPEEIHPGLMGPTWTLNGADRFAPDLLRDIRRAYYALITQIDYNLGLLLARLRERDELENTLILFTADHGEMLGDHHMGAKSILLEASARVPLLIRPPSGPGYEHFTPLRGSECSALTCLADVLPTFLAAAGSPQPSTATIDGIDLIAAAKGASQRKRIVGLCGEFSAVIESRYKYLFSESGGAELLFDLQEDPLEQCSLANSPHAAEHRQRLRQTLAETLESRGHPAALHGQLKATRPSPSRRETRANRSWPGFHHIAHTQEDLLH